MPPLNSCNELRETRGGNLILSSTVYIFDFPWMGMLVRRRIIKLYVNAEDVVLGNQFADTHLHMYSIK